MTTTEPIFTTTATADPYALFLSGLPFEQVAYFDPNGSLDQLLTTPLFSPSLAASPSSPSSVSATSMDSPPTSLLQDTYLEDLFPADPLGLQTDVGPFIKFEYNATLPTPLMTSTNDISLSPTQTATMTTITSPPVTPRKKTTPPGQGTMPIRVATQKSVRPPRHLECSNCKVTKTPLWRRTPDRKQTLCNACGLYFKQYNAHRPLHVRHKFSTARSQPYSKERVLAPAAIEEDVFLPPQGEHTECVNCHQKQTPLWRKNADGDPVCNACGLYAKMHHRDRPVEMRRTTIRRRRRDWADTEDSSDEATAPATPTTSSPNFSLSTNSPLMAPLAFDEDSSFRSLLLQMNRSQMEGFLDMLERRCHMLRNVLDIVSDE